MLWGEGMGETIQTPRKKIIAVSFDDKDIKLQISHPDGHISYCSPAEMAEAITEFYDGREWVRDMNESFRLLMSRLSKWVKDQNEADRGFVIPCNRPNSFLFVVIQKTKQYSIEFSLSLSRLNREIANDPRFCDFLLDVQEVPSTDLNDEEIIRMLYEW